MEHVRVAVPPPKTPAKNHVAPRCPTMQSSPVLSVCGFTLVGMETAHCHHSALNSSRDCASANVTLSGIISPKQMATIVMNRPVLLFMVSSREEELDARSSKHSILLLFSC